MPGFFVVKIFYLELSIFKHYIYSVNGENLLLIGAGVAAYFLIRKHAGGGAVNDLSFLNSDYDSSDVQRLQTLSDTLYSKGLSDLQVHMMLSQALQETGLFTDNPNYGAMDTKHNYAGISRNGSISSYPSLSDFADDWIRVLSLGTNRPIDAGSISDYNSRLKANGYYEDSQTTYGNNLNYYFNLLS